MNLIITRKMLNNYGITGWHGWRMYKKIHPGHILTQEAHGFLRDCERTRLM